MWKPVIARQMERKWMYLQVLQLIQQYGAISRVEIANKLHMTRASVTLLIHEMMEKGVLEDIGTCPTSEGKGRRKLLMDVHPSRWLLIGISIQGNHLVVGLTTLGMNTLEKQCIPFPVMQASWVSVQEQMIITVRQILKSNYIEESQILGLGVGLMPSVLQHFFPDATRQEQQMTELQQILTDALHVPVFWGNALPSMAVYCLYQKPKQEIVALFCADGADYYVSIVCRSHAMECLNSKPISMQGLPLSPNQTVGDLLTPVALQQRVKPYYSAEQTPVLYDLTGGKLETMTLPDLFTAACAEGKDFDPILSDLMEEMMQQFCQFWSSILVMYPIEQLYLYRPDFTLPHWQEIYRYAKQYMKPELAAKLSCGDLTEKCQYAGGVFYALDGGIFKLCTAEEQKTSE